MRRAVGVVARRFASRGEQRAVVPRPSAPQPPTPSSSSSSGAIAERASSAASKLRNSALADRAGAVSDRVFAGSSSGSAYAPDASSPTLQKVFRPEPARTPEPARAPNMPATSACSAPVKVTPQSLAELKGKSSAELRQMLAVRGVGVGAVTEKDELATWAFQHQDLPVKNPEAAPAHAPCRSGVAQPKSEADLDKLSVKELRQMLRERGVNEGSATEKGDLVKWVWQHASLPVVHTGRGQKQQGRWVRNRGFGMGGSSDPYDYEDDSQDKKREEEKPKSPEELEGADQQQHLLEAGEAAAAEEDAPSQWPRKLLKVAGFGVLGVFGAVGALIYLDAQRAEDANVIVQSARDDAQEHRRV